MKKVFSIVSIIASLLITGCGSTHPDNSFVSLNSSELTTNSSELVSSNSSVQTSDISSINSSDVTSSISLSSSEPISSASSSVEPELEDPVPLQEGKLSAYRYSKTNIVQVDVFYREDKLTRVPHISLKKFYKLMTSKTMTITKISPSVYEVKTANDEIAIINTYEDTLECADYENFISTTVYRQEGVGNYYYDGAPFLRVSDVIYNTEPETKYIDFKQYGIDLIGQYDDIILPVTTASNIFTGPTMLTCFCTNSHIYFIDPNDDNYETGSYLNNSTARKEILSNFDNNTRSKEIADFTYRELCFLIDTYYGLPGREYLHDDMVEFHDLDAVLMNKNSDTRKCREFLKSTNMIEYFAGLSMLDAFLSDAGHTVVDAGINYLDNSILTKITQKLDSVGFVANKYAAARNANTNYLRGLQNALSQTSIPDNSYLRYGDTLVYRFSSFMFDLNAWILHYKHPSVYTIPNDAFYNFVKMLEAYKNDTSIKNVVLDISANGGGYGDMVTAMMGLMCGNTSSRVYDTVGKNYVTTTFDLDANFDGVFDEKDKQVKYNFNFAILSSAYSFSCGNLLPAQAKDNGIMLLGDKSGGGSCAVVDTTTFEGLYVRLSCQNHFVTNNNEEVEMGVVPHKYLVEKQGNNYDFSRFYDFEYISDLMNEFYA